MVFPLEQMCTVYEDVRKGDEGGVVEPFFFILLLLFFSIICSGFKQKFPIFGFRMRKKRVFNDLDSMKQKLFYGHLTRFLKPYLSCLLKSI